MLRGIGIDMDRLRHSLAVGRTMSELARDLMSWDNEKCEDMFVLGFVHDIGYEFTETQPEHALLGGESLRRAGYRYWHEVSSHGDPHPAYASDELMLLNLADMTTGRHGKHVTIEQRLADIGARYGTESRQYVDAERLADVLRGWARERSVDGRKTS